MNPTQRLQPVPFTRVTLNDSFWQARVDTVRRVTIPSQFEICTRTGRLDAFNPRFKSVRQKRRHIFFDSDVAKLVEAASYALAVDPNPKLRRLLRNAARRIADAAQPDGYLNSYFAFEAPGQRWTNLRDLHELYCAGHLIEAAVAHCEATGKVTLLEPLRRYADLINDTFGRGQGKRRGYPGHEEIELALVRLYRATGEQRYLKLAKDFIDERGRRPHYFEKEARARSEQSRNDHSYWQAHLPVREQSEGVGHAVRLLYLLCGMADVAMETCDASLFRACERLWSSVCERRMYLTGGVGSTAQGEALTFDYDLPDETAYAETCAAIANVFLNHRMLQMTGDARYADVMERALYNGVLSGFALDGLHYFYANPLAVYDPDPPVSRDDDELNASAVRRHRVPWFGCACCPPNIARLLASVGGYMYSSSDKAAWVHLYAACAAVLDVGGTEVVISQETRYPWDGRIRITLTPAKVKRFTLYLRMPGWCRGADMLVAGKSVNVQRSVTSRNGYIAINRTWCSGDEVELNFDMPVERVYAAPEVRQMAGMVALQRGPLVYCVETVDNVTNELQRLILPRTAKLRAVRKRDLLGDVTVIKARGRMAIDKDGALYSTSAPRTRAVDIVAVPYCVWDNRRPGSMRVWLREQ
jgi:DUF1680 family protein